MGLLTRLRDDVEALKRGDPAARGTVEIVLVYSGLHAIWAHRLSTWLWYEAGWPGSRFLARILSQLTRTATGIEIHPAARLGQRLVIDHGMGLVIGETAVVGDDVVLYHGVTLGGRGPGTAGRRHPTVGDRVVIGAGAAVLGPVTIGDGARVGANSVVTHDVEPGAVVVGAPARPV